MKTMDAKIVATNLSHVKFNFTDIMIIKAISKRKTPLRKIVQYWDTFDRSYPNYVEFIQSINKLSQFGVIQIHDEGKLSTCTNRLFKKMNLVEKCIYFFNPSDEFLLSILSKFKTNTNIDELKISQQEYNEIIKEYRANANRL